MYAPLKDAFAEEIKMTEPLHNRYLAVPRSGKGMGVLVLHAWWGLNDFIRDFCDRLAQEGFVALAPDMFSGKIARTVDEAE
jgi:carboxymethylenebutenolidase